MVRARTNPWHDVFAFLLLASATMVMAIVIIVTQEFYPTFDAAGRAIAWGVAVGSVLALASLALILLRLYIQPVLATGRDRITNGHNRRKRNA